MNDDPAPRGALSVASGSGGPSAQGSTRGGGGGGDEPVGVLYLVPSLELFPLLAAGGQGYRPDTLDLVSDPEERDYWLDLLADHLPSLVKKAVASLGATDAAREQGDAFQATFSELLARVKAEPAAYGQLSLAGIFEMREECLRAFAFQDAYRSVKDAENAAALQVLPDLLAEVDALPVRDRLLALVEGVLAGNIFDWGSRACVELYHNGTILEIYRRARSTLARPWGIDNFDTFAAKLLPTDEQGTPLFRYRRALLFCDNSGADVLLGMIPFARELLRRGTDVVLVANSLPALNDVTATELAGVLAEASTFDETLRAALAAAAQGTPTHQLGPPRLMLVANGNGSPCIDLRRVSHELCVAAKGADLVVLEGMGRAIHTNLRARFSCDVVKLAMIKNSRLAKKIFGGALYDCVFQFEPSNESGV